MTHLWVCIGFASLGFGRFRSNDSAWFLNTPNGAKLWQIVTLKCIFNWAQKQELADNAPQLRGLVYGKRDEKPPFMTRTEIERIINRGGLSEIEIDQLWDAMYLTIPEVHEVLELVKERAR